MVLAALLVTVGPWLVRFIGESWSNTGTAAAAAVAVAVLAIALAQPATAAQAQGQPASIAAAIEAARPGDTVVIPPGEYHESVVITKPLTLVGKGLPVIDGGGAGDVVRIEADDVTLRGFVIRNSAQAVADEPAGVRAIGDRATVEGNHLEDVLYGVILQESNGHIIRDNHISSSASFAP
jgi:nitrous oxidase accessory protein